MIDNRTPNLNLPLPNVNNLMKTEDVPRIRDALASIDQAVQDRATHAEVVAAITSVVGTAPASLNTLKELADALNSDANYAATITAALASKLSSVPLATSVVVGGVKVGSGLIINDGVLSTTGAGSGSGLPAFAEVKFSPTSNGQTAFTPGGGYVAGQIELYQNGILLYGGGDDYTASNGTTITLAVGANIVDSFILRKWYYIPIEMAVNKTGDTMTGYLNVPPNASGTQVPRASEVVLAAGGTMTGPLVLSADPATDLAAATRQYVLSKMALYKVSRASNTILGVDDKAKLFHVTAGPFTQTLDASASLKDGWYCWYKNASSNTITLDPFGAETIDGASTVSVLPGQTVIIQCNGAALSTYMIDAGSTESTLYLVNGNGFGSAAGSRIRRYASIYTNVGGAFTYSDSATAGGTITINYTGNYFIRMQEVCSSGNTGVAVNSTSTVVIDLVDPSSRFIFLSHGGTATYSSGAALVRLTAGYVLRVHGVGAGNGAVDNDNRVSFYLKWMGP